VASPIVGTPGKRGEETLESQRDTHQKVRNTHNHDENAKNRLNVLLLFVCACFHFDFALFIITCDLLSFLLYLYELS